MAREARTRLQGEGLEEGEIVLGGDDRHVPHVGSERGKLGLHVDAGAVPPQERLVGKCVPQVVDMGKLARCGLEVSAAEELPQPWQSPSPV